MQREKSNNFLIMGSHVEIESFGFQNKDSESIKGPELTNPGVEMTDKQMLDVLENFRDRT